jgi:hypothetical protein
MSIQVLTLYPSEPIGIPSRDLGAHQTVNRATQGPHTIHGWQVKQCWKNIDKFSLNHITFMDRKSSHKTMMEAPLARRWFITKHLCGMCSISKFLLSWKESSTNNCPRFGSPEDTRHVWECLANIMNTLWQLHSNNQAES